MCYNINMKNRFDISEFVAVYTIDNVNFRLVERVRERRKEMGLTREELSKRSGVSYASIRRFEDTGQISLISLLKIANVFNTLKDFDYLFKDEIINSYKEY